MTQPKKEKKNVMKYYNLKNKLFVIVTILFLLLFIANNHYSLQNIDHLAYVVAMGIDINDNGNLELSIQIAKPDEISASSSSSQSSSSVINSVECSSIQEGISLLDSHISRTVNLSHCKVIVLAEKLVIKDFSFILNDLVNNFQVSRQATIIISKCNASTFLEMTNPVLETYTARYYNIIQSESVSTSFTQITSLMDFYSSSQSSFQEPVAVLSGINTKETQSLQDNFIEQDYPYSVGKTPITSKNNVENMGLAVFKKGKLVGELDALEAICHQIVTGNLEYCLVQVENPNDSSQLIDLRIQLDQNPKINIELINGSPYITINIQLNAQILSSNTNWEKMNQTDVEHASNAYLKKIINQYLYQISKHYQSDIVGFGKYALQFFLTEEDWRDYHWLENFHNSFFDVKVNTKIRSASNFIHG